jgi:hypothetical protein
VPDPKGTRWFSRLRAGIEVLGVAYEPADLLEFLRRAGLDDVDQVDLAAADWIDWHGGGPAALAGQVSEGAGDDGTARSRGGFRG